MISHPLPSLPSRGRVTSTQGHDNANGTAFTSPLEGEVGRGVTDYQQGEERADVQ